MADGARSTDPRVQAAIDRVMALSGGKDTLGLARINALLAALGDPHHRLPPVFHVAGTNGKGSTCALLRAGLEAAGYRVHVYTSPHLIRFNERIRIAGSLIDDTTLADLLERVLAAADATGTKPSFFEVTTAAALLAFAQSPADACVIEVGLGGRLDATNVFDHPLVTGIAQLGLDHQQFLGDDLATIAFEKAGIARAGVPLVAMDSGPVATDVIARHAAAVGSRLLVEGRDWFVDTRLQPLMSGAHQQRNASLAWAILSAQGSLPVSHDTFARAVRQTVWPGRLQRLDPGPLTAGREVWVDGAHNPDAAVAVVPFAKAHHPHLIAGLLANKDAAGILAALRPQCASAAFVAVPGHASHDPAGLACQWDGTAASDLVAALAAVPGAGPILITGSLYLVGEALRLNGQWPA